MQETYDTFWRILFECVDSHAEGLDPIPKIGIRRIFIEDNLTELVVYMLRRKLFAQLTYFEHLNVYPVFEFVDPGILRDCIDQNTTDAEKKIMQESMDHGFLM